MCLLERQTPFFPPGLWDGRQQYFSTWDRTNGPFIWSSAGLRASLPVASLESEGALSGDHHSLSALSPLLLLHQPRWTTTTYKSTWSCVKNVSVYEQILIIIALIGQKIFTSNCVGGEVVWRAVSRQQCPKPWNSDSVSSVGNRALLIYSWCSVKFGIQDDDKESVSCFVFFFFNGGGHVL